MAAIILEWMYVSVLNKLYSWRCYHDMIHIFWKVFDLRKVLVPVFWGRVILRGGGRGMGEGRGGPESIQWFKTAKSARDRCEITLGSDSDGSALDYHA